MRFIVLLLVFTSIVQAQDTRANRMQLEAIQQEHMKEGERLKRNVLIQQTLQQDREEDKDEARALEEKRKRSEAIKKQVNKYKSRKEAEARTNKKK
jgi:hypothetical protein